MSWHWTSFLSHVASAAHSALTITSLRKQEPRCDLRHSYPRRRIRSEEHTSELQSHSELVCRLLLEKKNPRLIIESNDSGPKPPLSLRTVACQSPGIDPETGYGREFRRFRKIASLSQRPPQRNRGPG